jgi:uncharacterized membrane protein SpoIIM required for sporulation
MYFLKPKFPFGVSVQKIFLYAFLFFILFTAMGVVSAIYDKDFANIILGEDYVNMTIENIKKGNAVGVYQSGSTWGSTIGIIFNNIGVGAKLYFYGIFGGVGTLFALLVNSVMLGSFQYFFSITAL